MRSAMEVRLVLSSGHLEGMILREKGLVKYRDQ